LAEEVTGDRTPAVLVEADIDAVTGFDVLASRSRRRQTHDTPRSPARMMFCANTTVTTASSRFVPCGGLINARMVNSTVRTHVTL